MQTWLILTLGFALLHSTVAILDKSVLKNGEIDALSFSTIRYAANSIVSLFFVLFIFGELEGGINVQMIVLSMLYFLAGVTYFYALKFDDVSKLMPYRDSINVLLSYFLAVIVLSERSLPTDFAAVLLISVGGYIVWTDGKLAAPRKSTGILLISASAVFLSLNGIVAKSLIVSVSPLTVAFFMYMLVTAYFSALVLLSRREEMKSTLNFIFQNKKNAVYTLFASFFAPLGVVMLFFALQQQMASKVLPLSGTLPLFAAIIGWLILKEKHGATRVFGSLLLIAGIYILSAGH